MIIERDDLSVRTVAIILATIAIVIAGVVYFPALKEKFQRWKQGGSIEQVKKFTAENDVPNALLAIRSALKQEPGNAAVWRLAADFAEQLGDPDSVSMREQVVRLEPEAVENRLALARTAIRFKDLLKARETLEALSAQERLTSEYRRVAAALAMASDLPAEATALLTMVLTQDPGDVQPRLDRSSLALRYGTSTLAAAARGELLALSERKETRLRALRELTGAALRDKDLVAALNYSEQLSAESPLEFADLLLRANVQIAANEATIDAVLPALEKRALSEPGRIPELAAWLSALNRTAQASTWLKSLPPDVRELPPVRVARANASIALREWEAARVLISEGAFGRISPDAVQLAFAARVLRDNDRPAMQRSTWDEAIRLASYDLSGLRVLHRLTLEWRWGPELNAVLLAIATQHRQTWAYQALVDRYFRARDTAGLKSTYALWRAAEPNSEFVEANGLFLELLTAPVNLPTQTKQRVADLYSASPANPFLATAHALALWQSERATDALAVMEQLTLSERRAPNRVLYMGLFLQTSGRLTEARRYLDLVKPMELLPEEQALYRSAKRANDSALLGAGSTP